MIKISSITGSSGQMTYFTISNISHPAQTGCNSVDYTINHNLGTMDILMDLYRTSSDGYSIPVFDFYVDPAYNCGGAVLVRSLSTINSIVLRVYGISHLSSTIFGKIYKLS